MKAVRTVMFLQLVLALGCASGPLDGSDETSDVGAAASPSDEESTGEVFDIDVWVGGYHHEHSFIQIGVENERAIPPASMFNLEVRGDHTATMTFDSCERDEPLVVNYEVLPIDNRTVGLWPPGIREHSMWGDVMIAQLTLERSDCGNLTTERTSSDGRTTLTEWSPGNVCWIIHCERTLSENSYHVLIDYCDGEGPIECEPGPD